MHRVPTTIFGAIVTYLNFSERFALKFTNKLFAQETFKSKKILDVYGKHVNNDLKLEVDQFIEIYCIQRNKIFRRLYMAIHYERGYQMYGLFMIFILKSSKLDFYECKDSRLIEEFFRKYRITLYNPVERIDHATIQTINKLPKFNQGNILYDGNKLQVQYWDELFLLPHLYVDVCDYGLKVF